MMRQYELVERVLSYDPKADEALLNRAYVYAMKAHGNQKRASGESVFLPPARSRRHPHRSEARRRDHRHGAAARRHRGHAHHPGGDRPAVRPRDRQAGRRPDQDPPPRPRLQEGRAGGELPQAARRHLQRHPRAARQARRPRAQHAHARAHEAGDRASASPRKRSTSMPRSPRAWAWRRCARSWRITPSAGCIRTPTRR